MSSTKKKGRRASRLVDGSTKGWGGTFLEDKPWMEIDLGDNHCVFAVKTWNLRGRFGESNHC